jgi:SAM-dependent methyltransferase
MACLFCTNKVSVPTAYPRNIYNNKEFRYIKCTECGLVYLDNLPAEDDYQVMYPPSYQRNEVEAEILKDPYEKLYGLRVSYGYQFDLIKKHIGSHATMLDYGCGTGHFLANAIHYGFKTDGAEFNPEYLQLLRKHFTGSEFYSIQDILADGFTARYDVIRLSNVLEHLSSPLEIIHKLKNLLNPGGLLLVEGPIEENISLAANFRKVYFRLSKWISPNRAVSDPPYHIFFSTARNQRQFFKNCGFEELHFATAEDAWPFPQSVREAAGIKNKLMALVGRISKKTTKAIGKNWGNIFIYCGTPHKGQ